MGKKWFVFSKMDIKAMEMITILNDKNGGGDEQKKCKIENKK